MATYYVAKTGNDANPGTIGSPKLTIQAGVDLATANGDIVTVGDGEYVEEVTFSTSGSSGNLKTVRSENHLGATVSSVLATGNSTAALNHWPFYTNGYDYWTIGGEGHGFNIVGGENGVLAYPGSVGIQVLYNTITYTWGSAINIYGGSNDAIVQGNTVHDNVRNNWPRGQAILDERLWGGAIQFGGNCTGGQVLDNIVYWNSGEGIPIYDGSSNTQIRRNIVADNWSVNIYVDASAGCIVDRNFSYVSTDALDWPDVVAGANLQQPDGIAISSEDYGTPLPADGVRVTNNLVVNALHGIDKYINVVAIDDDDHVYANNTCVGNTAGIDIQSGGAISNFKIQNNIVTGAINPIDVTIRIKPAPSGSTISNNRWNTTTEAFYWGSSSQLSFASWVSSSGETNSTNGADPLLVDASVIPGRLWSDESLPAPDSLATVIAQIANYALQSGSGAIDAGADLSAYLTTDYTGATRPIGASFDIGAFEFADEEGAEYNPAFVTNSNMML